MTNAPPDLVHRLRTHGQDHVLAGWDTLAPAERSAFVGQLAGIDLAELGNLHKRKHEPHAVLPPRERIAPLPVESPSASAKAIGEAALRNGEVAALLVAGGQGTRLGFDKPKGLYPAGPVTGGSLK